jgi:hypothetical protein
MILSWVEISASSVAFVAFKQWPFSARRDIKLSSFGGLIENVFSSNSIAYFFEILLDSSDDKPCTCQFLISSVISFEIANDPSESAIFKGAILDGAILDGPARPARSAVAGLVLPFGFLRCAR